MTLQDHLRSVLRNHGRILGKMAASMLKTREGLRLHHKILYTACTFFGVVLVWYGLWDIVTAIPFLDNPLVALAVGVGLLFFTGTFFKELG